MTILYTRPVFQTGGLNNAIIQDRLKLLCVAFDEAKHGDILAIEFPMAMQASDFVVHPVPYRIMVRWGDAIRAMSWFMLLKGGVVGTEKLGLVADMFCERHDLHKVEIAAEIKKMSTSYEDHDQEFSLFLLPGAGFLVNHHLYDTDHLEENLPDDQGMQDHIGNLTQLVLPQLGSAHERIQARVALERAEALCARAYPVHDPRTDKPVKIQPDLDVLSRWS